MLISIYFDEVHATYVSMEELQIISFLVTELGKVLGKMYLQGYTTGYCTV